MIKVVERTRHTAEEVVNKLRQADVELAKGTTVTGVCKLLAISEQTCYAWRREYGGLKVDQAKRFKELEQENARLKRLLDRNRAKALRSNPQMWFEGSGPATAPDTW